MRSAAATPSRRVAARAWRQSLAGALALVALIVAVPAGAGGQGVGITTVSPQDGQTVSGAVRWEVALGGEQANVVDFSIDGVLRWSERNAPYVFNGNDGTLDTTKLSDGWHTLAATAFQGKTQKAQTSVRILVANGQAPGLVVSTVTPANGQTLSGPVTWEVKVAGETPTKVDFAVDGAVRWTEQNAPYVFNGNGGTLDTKTLADGPHTLSATAYGPSGSKHTSSISVTVSNPPAFATNVSNGMTITTPFAWTFTPGSSAVRGFFWADGKLLATLDGPGPYTWTLPTGLLTAGAHTLGHSWERLDGLRESPGSGYGVTVVNGGTSGGGGSGTSTPSTWPSTAEPAYTPNRIATTPTEFRNIMGSLRTGDVVEVRPMTIIGQFNFTARVAAEIHMLPGVKFAGAAQGSQGVGVWVNGANLRLYGGEVTNPLSGTNDCVRVSGASAGPAGAVNVRWWGLKIHGCAATGLSVQGTPSYPNSGLDIEAEIWDIGRDLSLDPHAEKGTGLHCAYIGGGWSATTNSRFLLRVHDCQAGAGVQAGRDLRESELWIDAARLTFMAQSQVAGNALQVFGYTQPGVVVKYLRADDITGHAIDVSNSMNSTALSTWVVEWARATNFSKNTRVKDFSYDTWAGIRYLNADPGSFGTD